MENEKVLKGLELCPIPEPNCDDCPYKTTKDCTDKLMKDAVTLINLQQKKIDELTDKHWSECRQIAHYSDKNSR